MSTWISSLTHTYIPSNSPSFSVVIHPVSFIPRGHILVIIDCTLANRHILTYVLLTNQQWMKGQQKWSMIFIWVRAVDSCSSIPSRVFCRAAIALCTPERYWNTCGFQPHGVWRWTLHPQKSCHPARCMSRGPWAHWTQTLPVRLGGYISSLALPLMKFWKTCLFLLWRWHTSYFTPSAHV